MSFRIALVGNPNCGKSTLFNNLTGLHQKVGNWPGVTVEQVSGEYRHAGEIFHLVDLPGLYSLDSGDTEEAVAETIAQNFLAHGQLDLLLNIVDSSTLERDLSLTVQLRQLNRPMVVALNMMDVVAGKGMQINCEALSRRLGCPVVPVIASRSEGLSTLRQVVADSLSDAASNSASPPFKVASDDIHALYRWVDQTVTATVRSVPQAGRRVSEWLDEWLLNRWLGLPLFLLSVYLIFFLTINIGGAFIDLFDGVAGAFFVELPRELLSQLDAPVWLTVFVADGVGGGIQLVASFIPVIGVLFLCLSFLEDSGYMSRMAFLIDRLMTRLGLPGQSFVPLIVGFGCNVPSVMATRALTRQQDRLLVTVMAPFMSCGARLTVYALFAVVFFPSNGLWLVFTLYLSGAALAVLSGLIIRRFMLTSDRSALVMTLPDYHWPRLKSMLIHTWHRLRAFMLRAGKAIVLVVIVLNLVSSWGVDGTFGNQNMEKSWLSVIGKKITPMFEPMGITQDNWPATVGIFTGMFAKEVVVGTLDSLYGQLAAGNAVANEEPAEWTDLLVEAFAGLPANLEAALAGFPDPLGLSAVTAGEEAMMEEQGVQASTLHLMNSLFGSTLAAFCYLFFVLLYVPCVSTIGAIYKEYGTFWAAFSTLWSTIIAYTSSVTLYQTGTLIFGLPGNAGFWVPLMLLITLVSYGFLLVAGRWQVSAEQKKMIPVLQIR